MTTHPAIIDAPRRKFSVEEYHRLIDLNNDRVTVYRDPDGEQFLQVKTYRKGEIIRSAVLPESVPVEKVLI